MSNTIQTQNAQAVQHLLEEYTKEELQDAVNMMFVASLYSEQCDQEGIRIGIVALWSTMCAFINETSEV